MDLACRGAEVGMELREVLGRDVVQDACRTGAMSSGAALPRPAGRDVPSPESVKPPPPH